jgi:hypothetical protein
VASPAEQYFPTSSKKGTIFGKKLLNKNACFDFLYDFGLKNFSFEEELSAI